MHEERVVLGDAGDGKTPYPLVLTGKGLACYCLKVLEQVLV